MISILFCFSLSSTNADIKGPIEINSDGTVGSWRFFGASRATKQNIILVHPIRKQWGQLWTSTRFPETDWSARFDFYLFHASNNFRFGIFYIENNDGGYDYFGGPSLFKGLAILFEVEETSSDKNLLHIYIIQSDGSVNLKEYSLGNPEATYEIEENTRFGLIIQFVANQIHIQLDNFEQMFKVAATKQHFDFNDYFLGLCAINTGFVSGLALNEVAFELKGNPKINPVAESALENTTNLTKITKEPKPQMTDSFKSPFLKSLSREYKIGLAVKFDPLKDGMFDNTTLETVFHMIDEAGNATYDMATHKQLDHYVETELGEFINNWAALISYTAESLGTVSEAYEEHLNKTGQIMETFQEKIHELFNNSLENAAHFASEINDSQSDFDYILEETSNPFVGFLFVLSIIEVVGICFLFVRVSYTNIRRSAIPLPPHP